MDDFEEAMSEIGIDKNSTSDEKMRVVCQWILGDPAWWGIIRGWMHEAGIKIEDDSNE